jgi:hypothetical protein
MSLTAAAARLGIDAALKAQLPAAAATLAIAPPLAFLLWLSGDVSPAAALGTMALFVFVVMSAGLLLLRAVNAADMPAAAAWVLGVFATAIAVYGLVVSFQLLAATAFALWSGLVLALGIVLRKRAPAAVHGSELLGLLLCAAATAFWCGDLARAPHFLWQEGVLTTWVDQFIHGSLISQLGDPLAAGRGSIELAGFPPPAYHYATYALPAALAWPLDLPGLTLATSVWVPLGFLTLCAGVYTLGHALAGQGGGFAALAALTLLPDAAAYGLYNRLFGYYWYVIAVPSASYGIGVALLALALLKRWTSGRDLRPLAGSAGLIAGLALVRVHIFILALPVWIACAALSTQPVRRRALLFCGGALAGLGVFVWAFYRGWPGAQHALELFLDVAHNQQHPTAYRGLYEGLTAVYGTAVAVPVGLLLIFPAMLGVFTFLYPVSVLLARRARGLTAFDLVPPALLLCYLLLMITAPVPSHGDSTEFTQRPFVLVYAVIATWTAAGFASWLATRGGIGERRVWLPLFIVAVLAVLWILHGTVADWRWAYGYKVAEGLPRAAAFIRANARAGDVLAVEALPARLVTTDAAVQLVSMTGVPAYLSRPFMQTSAGGARQALAMQRYAELGGLARETSTAAALERLRRLGVQWYVVAESDRRGPRWDPGRRNAVFVDGMVAVYSSRPLSPDEPANAR